MKKEETKIKIKPQQSIESAIKCLENAGRLFDDAAKVSEPTAIGLIEIAIEEIAKGILLVPKMDENDSRLPLNDPLFKEVFMGNLDLVELVRDLNIKKYTIIDFNFRNHKKKLELINTIVEIYFKISPILIDKVDFNFFASYLHSTENFYTKFENIEDVKKEIFETSSKVLSAEINNLDYLKQQGFYVDISGESSKAPWENSFDSTTTLRIFMLCYFLLNLFIQFSRGSNFKTILDDKEKSLGILSKYMDQNLESSKDSGTSNNEGRKANEGT